MKFRLASHQNGISVGPVACVWVSPDLILFLPASPIAGLTLLCASAVGLHQREIIRGACSRCGSTTCSDTTFIFLVARYNPQDRYERYGHC
ncbi:hypothetical protein KCP71_11615 [Salmonella enterica subsp. enterica]|nr:hypothetical protein KCP71_11615 [Salmonella enterica subsp. enterica]